MDGQVKVWPGQSPAEVYRGLLGGLGARGLPLPYPAQENPSRSRPHQCSDVWSGEVRSDLVSSGQGLVWSGQGLVKVWSGEVRSSLVRSRSHQDLVWSGQSLVWSGQVKGYSGQVKVWAMSGRGLVW